MATGRNISLLTLRQWINNFRNNLQAPIVTNSATISLSQLENYVADVKQNSPSANGFRISLIRFSMSGSGTTDLQSATNDLSQLSLVITPLTNYNPSTGAGSDASNANNEVFGLAFSDPGNTGAGDSFALCPPKCGF